MATPQHRASDRAAAVIGGTAGVLRARRSTGLGPTAVTPPAIVA